MVFGCRYSKDDPEFLKSVEYIGMIAEGFDDSLGNVADYFPCLKLLPFPSLTRLKIALRIRDDVMSCQLQQHREANLKVPDLANKMVPDNLKVPDLANEMVPDLNLKVPDLANEMVRDNLKVPDLANKRVPDLINERVPDFTTFLLRKSEQEDVDGTALHGLEDKHLKLLMFDLFGSGVDTTVVALSWAVVYLIRWPSCQEKMLAEIENLRPNKSRIEICDFKDLPYCQAVVYETLRMCSLFPISPRKATRDTELLGYEIKKGADIVFNLWGVNHDERHWSRPYEFTPERFLDQDGKLKCLNRLSYLPFSMGRRGCPGAKIAEKEIFLILGTLLQHCEVKASRIMPSLEPAHSVSYKPKPFTAIFAPR